MPRCAMTSAASPAVASIGQRDRGCAHHVAHRRRERPLRQHDAADHVLPREDAERPRSRIDDRHRADPVVLHRLQRVAERRLRAADDRRLPQQARAAASRVPRCSVSVAAYSACSCVRDRSSRCASRRVQKSWKIRRRADQRVEDRGRKHEAERVLRRAVDAGDAAPREQRAQRKHLAGRELPQTAVGARASGRSPRTVPCRMT